MIVIRNDFDCIFEVMKIVSMKESSDLKTRQWLSVAKNVCG